MKRQVAILFCVVGSVSALGVQAQDYAVKVECEGNCKDVDLWDACAQAREDHGGWLSPISISCDASASRDGAWASCGNGLCWGLEPGEGGLRVGDVCADGGGRDAIVTCSSNSWNNIVRRVECNGDCNDVTFHQACPSNSVPAGISCDGMHKGMHIDPVKFPNGAVVYPNGPLSRPQKIGDYCKDGSGPDAVVTCNLNTANTFSALKVECMDDCSHVTLGQVCDAAWAGSVPIQVSCDNTAGTGATHTPCYQSSGGSSCTVTTALSRGQSLSRYCADGSGIDAIVTCLHTP